MDTSDSNSNLNNEILSQDVSSHVTVKTSSSIGGLNRRERQAVGGIQSNVLFNGMISDEILLGRWRLTLELFGRVFIDDVGLEPGSTSKLYTYKVRVC